MLGDERSRTLFLDLTMTLSGFVGVVMAAGSSFAGDNFALAEVLDVVWGGIVADVLIEEVLAYDDAFTEGVINGIDFIDA